MRKYSELYVSTLKGYEDIYNMGRVEAATPIFDYEAYIISN